jgi:hypothetical protein
VTDVVAGSAHRENVVIGAKRSAPLRRTLAGLTATGWADVTDLPGVQVADYGPAGETNMLCCRVRRAESA